MDYSKLSNEELIALKKRDYSKLSNETLLELKSGQAQRQSSRMDLGQAIDSVKNADGFFGTANAALKVPEKMSRQGLTQLAEMSGPNIAPAYTGSLPRDIAMNTGRVAMETLADTAPEFVSEAAILTAGASKLAGGVAPLAKNVLRGAGRQVEQVTGAAPGSLEAAYKDASLMGAKGKKAVSELYDEAKQVGGGIRQELKATNGKLDFVKRASELADDGTLTPTEALEARKELVRIKKQVTDVFFRETSAKLDAIAKKAFASSDAAFKRAVQAESLRNLFPQNKYGGASSFKMGIMAALENMGLAGKAAGVLMSPAAAGAAATSAGIAGRHAIAPLVGNPRVAASAAAVLDNLAKKRKRR